VRNIQNVFIKIFSPSITISGIKMIFDFIQILVLNTNKHFVATDGLGKKQPPQNHQGTQVNPLSFLLHRGKISHSIVPKT
jgi:hypothetical protein